MIALGWLAGCAPLEVSEPDTGHSGPPAHSGEPTVPEPPTVFTTTTATAAGDPVPLELCVNELMAANVASVADDLGTFADWIELHNPGDTAVALDGWSLTDDPAEPDEHLLAGGLVLEPGGFLVLWADNRPELGATHLDFSLSDAGESVGLFAPDGSGAVITFGPAPDDLALARAADCCPEPGCLGWVLGGTPGASNHGSP